MKQKLILVISIIAGLLAFILTGQYLKNEKAKIRGRHKLIMVVGAAHDLPAGSSIKFSDLGKIRVFKSSVGDRAVLPESVREIIGKKLLYNINKNNPILWSDIDVPFGGIIGLAEMINPGNPALRTPSMRGISISVDMVSSVSGMVKPNDHVDILGTFTFPSQTITGEVETVTLTVLQDVTVLATGKNLAKTIPSARSKVSQRSRGYNTVTFEVTPREAELLVFTQAVRGRLTLSLRNPSDVSFITDLPLVNFEYLQKNISKMNTIRQRDVRHKKDI